MSLAASFLPSVAFAWCASRVAALPLLTHAAAQAGCFERLAGQKYVFGKVLFTQRSTRYRGSGPQRPPEVASAGLPTPQVAAIAASGASRCNAATYYAVAYQNDLSTCASNLKPRPVSDTLYRLVGLPRVRPRIPHHLEKWSAQKPRLSSWTKRLIMLNMTSYSTISPSRNRMVLIAEFSTTLPLGSIPNAGPT